MSGDWLDLIAGVGSLLVPTTESRLRDLERARTSGSAADRPWVSAFDPPDPVNESRAVTHGEYKALAKQVAQLQVMMAVLAEALAAKGAIDGAWAGERLRERLDALEPKKPEPKKAKKQSGAVETYRGEGARPEKTIACASCQKAIPKRASRLTAKGAVCDACFEE